MGKTLFFLPSLTPPPLPLPAIWITPSGPTPAPRSDGDLNGAQHGIVRPNCSFLLLGAGWVHAAFSQ